MLNYDNENYYQLCTKKLFIAIDSHYHFISEVFLNIVFKNIIYKELLITFLDELK